MSNVNGSFLDKNGLTYLWSKLKELIGAKASVDDIYGLGPNTVIANNADLDEFKTPGIYRRTSASNSNINSCPSPDAAFKLIVEYVNSSSRYRQSVYPLYGSGTYYVRVFGSSNSWGAWQRFDSTYGNGIVLSGTSSNHIDLNDYLTTDKVGCYYTTNSANTGYLDNCPHSGSSIRLEVSKAGGFISQMIFANDNTGQVIYRRTAVEGDSSKIGDWQTFHDVSDTYIDIYGRGTEIPYKKLNSSTGEYDRVSLDSYTTPGRYYYNGSAGGIIDNAPAVVFTYTKVTSSTKPSDWDTEYYLKYFENTGTASNPVYSRLQKEEEPPTYVENTYYTCTGVGGNLTVEVLQRTDRFLQRFYPLNGPGDAAYFFQREYVSSNGVIAWTAWYRVDGTGAIGRGLQAETDVTKLTPGRYYRSSSATITGLPSGFVGAFLIEVTATLVSSRRQLILYRVGTDDDGTIWRRLELSSSSGGWQPWIEYHPINKIPLDIYGFGTATTLDSTANANSLTTPGVYVLNSNNNPSITNFPLKNKAFKLVVEYVNGTTRYRQTLYPLDSTCTYYVRMKTADGDNGWGAWYQFSGTAVS